MKYTDTAYKYREIGEPNSKERLRLEEMFVERKCHFAKPSTLNDPFDCEPYTHFEDPAKLRKSIQNRRKKLSPQKPGKGEITKTMQDIKSAYQGYSLRELFDKYIGVFCLSKSALLSLQWSHYGDSHKGICLEFDFGVIEDWYSEEVDYTNNRVSIDLLDFQENEHARIKTLLKAVYSKGMDWEIEQEVRAISQSSGLKPFPSEGLKSVIFGLSTPKEYQEDIVELIIKSDLSPRLYKCTQSSSHYNLELSEISSNNTLKATAKSGA
jgi:hypothetical protein